MIADFAGATIPCGGPVKKAVFNVRFQVVPMSGPNHKPNIFSSVSGWPTVAKSGWLSRGHPLPRMVLNDRGRNGKGRGKKLMKGAGAAPALLENQCVGQAELVIDVSNLI